MSSCKYLLKSGLGNLCVSHKSNRRVFTSNIATISHNVSVTKYHLDKVFAICESHFIFQNIEVQCQVRTSSF